MGHGKQDVITNRIADRTQKSATIDYWGCSFPPVSYSQFLRWNLNELFIEFIDVLQIFTVGLHCKWTLPSDMRGRKNERCNQTHEVTDNELSWTIDPSPPSPLPPCILLCFMISGYISKVSACQPSLDRVKVALPYQKGQRVQSTAEPSWRSRILCSMHKVSKSPDSLGVAFLTFFFDSSIVKSWLQE